jgi:hypothetical protein
MLSVCAPNEPQLRIGRPDLPGPMPPHPCVRVAVDEREGYQTRAHQGTRSRCGAAPSDGSQFQAGRHPGGGVHDLVGPGWVAVAAFTVPVVFHGMLVAALAGRLSRAVPLLAARPGVIAVHAPLLLVLPGPSVALVLIIVGVLVVLVAFPGFVSDLVDILGRA